MKSSDIEKKQADRLRLLYELYSYSTTKAIDIKELASKNGLKNGVFEGAFNFLIGERLIENEEGVNYKITHEGIKIMEKAILSPGKKVSDLFPEFNDLDIKE